MQKSSSNIEGKKKRRLICKHLHLLFREEQNVKSFLYFQQCFVSERKNILSSNRDTDLMEKS